MRRRADASVHDQRHAGQAGAQGAQREGVEQALARADRCAPGHQQLAAGVQQPAAGDEVVGAVGKDLEAVAHQLLGRGHQLPGVGLQGVLVAHHLELDPGRVVELSGHVGQGDGLARAAAAGGVGQQLAAGLAQRVAHGSDKAVVARCGQRAFQAHGEHLGAAGAHGLAQHLGRGIAGGAEQEAARQGSAVEGEAHRVSLR
mmetsp:Transcript_23376/g.55626  ORF Transcript_23376/g.55626 Transcript_23376/m.55626 type:complete len:201 (+) Transcript_23376:954-1556(+)